MRSGNGMKKLAILMACLLACLTLFTGCTDEKSGSDQNSDGHSFVEVDVSDGADITNELVGSDTLPGGITYDFADPENSAGIVVTPKE